MARKPRKKALEPQRDTRWSWVTPALVAASGLTAVMALPWPGGDFDARVAGALLCASAWAIAWALLPAIGWAPDRNLTIASAVLAGSVLLSAAVSGFPAELLFAGNTASLSALVWVAGIVVFALCASLPIGPGIRTGSVLTLAWVVPVAVIGMLQMLAGGPPAILKNATYFGLLMVAFAPVAIGLAADAEDRRGRIGWYLATVLLAAAAILTRSAAVTGALVAEAIALVWFLPRALGLAPGRMVRAAAGVATGLIALGAVVLQVPAVLRSVAGVVPTGLGGATWVTRSYLWEAALSVAAARPLVGAGPDAYSLRAQAYLPEELYALEWNASGLGALPAEPHSAVWTTVSMLGLLGALALAAVCVFWVTRVRRQREDVAEGPTAIRSGYVVATGGLALALAFSPLSPLLGLLLSLVAGLAVAASKSSAPPLDRRSPALVIAVLGVAVAVTTLVGVRIFSASSVATASTRGTSSDLAVALERARAATPYRPDAKFLALMQQGMNAGPGSVTAWQQAVDAETGVVSQYAPYLTEFVRVGLDEAGRSGRADLSWEAETLARAERLSPTLPSARLMRLRLSVMIGDERAVREALEEIERSGLKGELVDSYTSTANRFLGQ